MANSNDDLLDLNLDNDFYNILNPESNNEEISNNWTNYYSNINSQITTMWNFLLYNQFNNEEIRRLQRQNKYLEDDLERCNTDYSMLTSTNDNLKFENKRLKRKIRELEDDNNPNDIISPPNKRKKKDILLEESKNNEISELDKTEYDTIIKKIFNELNSIQDIINLKNEKYRFNFINNKKFSKIYNLIPVLEDLNSIIGMNNVKDSIFKAICYFLHGFENKKELNHVMITGPPGVGKTTIAKIIGKIYLDLGFLENDKFITARRSDLIAKYLGQTAIKTQKVIDDALGGVLFIDEVYSLGNSEQRDSFAKECIDTLNLNMTREDKPWLLIVGGYKEDIQSSFLAYNKGLERRFTVRLNINGYNAEELYQILLKFIKDDKWNIEKNGLTVNDIEKNIKNFKYFAGDMQKIFQKAKQFYSIRLMKELTEFTDSRKVLSREDMISSIYYLVDNLENKNDDMDESIRCSMYM